MEIGRMTDKPLKKQALKKRLLMPQWMSDANAVRREEGIKGMIKKGGWGLFAAFFVMYLIRDTILYVLPFMLGANCLTEIFQ
jgi:hypothetical protein